MYLDRVLPSALAHVAGLVSSVATATIERPLALPRGVPVVAVGGSTFGGSGKTRVALACASSLAREGARVVLVGHAYRARPLRPRIVTTHDVLEEVGDEALVCARGLDERGFAERASVVVAPTRQAAVDYAASLDARPDVIVIDGPLQTSPVRASLSILAVDAHVPWGGWDLRAPREALLARTDHVVRVDATPEAALLEGRRIPIASMAHLRLGLFTALARPDRLVRGLARSGIVPRAVVHTGDHGPLRASARRRLGRFSTAGTPVDVWLATSKCATHLDAAELAGELRVAIVDDAFCVPKMVERALRALRTGTAPE